MSCDFKILIFSIFNAVLNEIISKCFWRCSMNSQVKYYEYIYNRLVLSIHKYTERINFKPNLPFTMPPNFAPDNARSKHIF